MTKTARARRPSHSEMVSAQGGCNTCHGGNAAWTGKNAVSLAAQHYDRTKHKTWATQTIRTAYGDGRHTRGQGSLI